MKNYPQDFYKNHHPLQSYYSNIPSDSKNAQIKRYLPSYAESDPPKTFPSCPPWNNNSATIKSQKKTLLLKRKISPNPNQSLLNLEIPSVNPLNKPFQPPVSLKMESPHTSSPKPSRALCLSSPVSNATKSNPQRNQTKKFHKSLKVFLAI